MARPVTRRTRRARVFQRPTPQMCLAPLRPRKQPKPQKGSQPKTQPDPQQAPRKENVGVYRDLVDSNQPIPRLMGQRRTQPSPTSNNNNFKVVFWNVNSLRSLLKSNAKVLEEIFSQEKPDFLGLSETKTNLDVESLCEEQIKEIAKEAGMEEVGVLWHSCAGVRGRNGVCLIYKKKFKLLNLKFGLDSGKFSSLGRVLTAQFPEFCLVLAYVPNSGQGLKNLTSRLDEWDVDFFNYVKKLKKDFKVVLMGDLNVCDRDEDIYNLHKPHSVKVPGCTPEERESYHEGLKALLTDSLYSVYDKTSTGCFTYWTWTKKESKQKNYGLRLDYVLFDPEKLHCTNFEILKEISPKGDHCPVLAELDV